METFRPIQSWERTPSRHCMEINDDGSINSNTGSKPYGLEAPLRDVVGMDPDDLQRDMLEYESLFQFYHPHAGFVPYRRYLVDWMSDLGERFRLNTSTVHCAILYMDKILSSRVVDRNKWQLLGTAALSVASKYEEAEEHCPPIPELIDMVNLRTSSVAFRDRGELEVLRLLGWQLRALPPVHFVNFYQAKGVLFENDRWQKRAMMEKIPRYVRKYAEFFCNLCLQDYSFSQYRPSVLAAAIIVASRQALCIEPLWRPELQAVTGFTQEQVHPLFLHVWQYYEEQFPGHGVRVPSPDNVMAAPH